MQVIKKISHLEDQTKLTPWLYQICRNKIIDHYRVKKLPTVSLESSESHDFVADDETSPGMEQIENCIGILIANLPNNYSGILFNSDIQALKHKDIASAQQLSVSAVKSRVRRARILLKKELEACCTIEVKGQGVQSYCA
ncbi:MAG: RNA polymerase sigma-70 factor (ECF subfamily) [Oceanospirillaceae bacterium]